MHSILGWLVGFCVCLIFSALSFTFGMLLINANVHIYEWAKQQWMGFLQIGICIIFMIIYFSTISLLQIVDLKKAAKAVGEKSIAMLHLNELLPLTGYVRGGCSPIGMKKQFRTTIDDSCLRHQTIVVSAGKIGYQVELAPADLLALVRGQTADITVEV